MIELSSKVCRICKEEKLVTEFHSKKAHCKSCNIDYDLQRRYGISKKTYDVMLKKQNYLCAICFKHVDKVGTLVVDHDHACCPGRKTCGLCVRKLLCGYCNRGLGMFFDDFNLLAEAYNYLHDYKFKEKNID